MVAGPGALDGIAKCFTDTGGMTAAEVITWMRDTSRDHFARLSLDFADLWGRWPTLIVCWPARQGLAALPASTAPLRCLCREGLVRAPRQS
jgi:hypothetical protein